MSDPADPGQYDLGLPREGRALSGWPWQVELGYRVVLNASLVMLVLGARWTVERVAGLLDYAELPRAPAIMVEVFDWGAITLTTVMVVFDFLRFSYRRAPEWLKRRLKW